MNDVTDDTAAFFTFNGPATWEEDFETSSYWSVSVDNSNGDLVDGDVYIWALTATYYDGYNTDLVYHTATVPFIVMDKMTLPIDFTPYTERVDGYLDMIDPIITNHFFDIAALIVFTFGVFLPAMASGGQLALAAFLPPAYWGMIVFNGPITLTLAGYWYLVYT